MRVPLWKNTLSKRALVTGITGQDGAYLAKLLLEKNYEVYGTYRRLSTPNFWRLQDLEIFSKVQLVPADLLDMGSLLEAITVSDPHEIYNMAAVSFVGTTFEQPVGNAEINGLSVTKFLEAIRFHNDTIKFYQASSSEMFGESKVKTQDESTNFYPVSPYAASKAYAHYMIDIYRKAYGIFAVSGILFNHESPLRAIEAVSRKITNEVAKISLGLSKELVLGNIKAARDWGYAPEYVEMIYKMIQRNEPLDLVISTDETHTVEEFAKIAFELVGLNWKKYVKVDKKYFRPLDLNYLKGNSSKARRTLKWKPKVKFAKLIEIMINADIKRWKKFVNGEKFPWDAPQYPSEMNIINRKNKIKNWGKPSVKSYKE